MINVTNWISNCESIERLKIVVLNFGRRPETSRVHGFSTKNRHINKRLLSFFVLYQKLTANDPMPSQTVKSNVIYESDLRPKSVSEKVCLLFGPFHSSGFPSSRRNRTPNGNCYVYELIVVLKRTNIWHNLLRFFLCCICIYCEKEKNRYFYVDLTVVLHFNI